VHTRPKSYQRIMSPPVTEEELTFVAVEWQSWIGVLSSQKLLDPSI
jgi:hypothetical protein